METFIKTKAYDDNFKKSCKTGWGCGYVYIHKNHPILVETLEEDDWGYYLQPSGCPEEISFSSWDKDREYYIIGFDTAHSFNNDLHDESYVTAQANKIKELVDAYTAEDAKLYAQKQISRFVARYSKYL
jgi:hypothetical protein